MAAERSRLLCVNYDLEKGKQDPLLGCWDLFLNRHVLSKHYIYLKCLT
jgi:hypothetical protein